MAGRRARARRWGATAAIALACGVAGLASSPARAESTTPFQVSVTPSGVQWPTEDRAVRGVSFNPFYGMQPSVSGFELGLVNGVEGDFRGVGLGMANAVAGSAQGVQLAAASDVEGDVDGLQLGALASLSDASLDGLQVAIGVGAKRVAGAQLGLYAWAGDRLEGVQLATVNRTDAQLAGAQIGALVSWAGTCNGLQIGPIFTRAESGTCAQIGLLNWNGDGFLPFFPLFNFGVR